jgi:superfamily II DNA or RNA helicase/HKD family nuclease
MSPNMPVTKRGLYELLVSEALQQQLSELDDSLSPQRSGLHEAEAADRITLHLARVLERAIASLAQADRVSLGIALARELISVIAAKTDSPDETCDRPVEPAQVLRAILGRLPDGRSEAISEPLIPLMDTTLLTNAPGEPRVGSQLLTEIHSADRIDIVMAFIRQTGIAPMLEALRAHCLEGRELRILTTTYTGSTEARALDRLREIGADVRVSYDLSGTRLHAKAWLFHRHSGFSTAYIGSSNLTHSAQVSGLEWNVRVSGARNRSVVDKMIAVFESYWNGGDFIAYDREQFLLLDESSRKDQSTVYMSPIELRPEPFQERLLEQIALSRQRGFHRNLLVSATGTGKTVMAALDYERLSEELPRSRLLFVAHREEILTQSLATFRHALRDHAFGELWVGGKRPMRFEHVFASIQSLNAGGFNYLDPGHFDVVIVDEFHHAAAASYRALLEHVQPLELLGLTATPERSDGLPILDWFDGRIAAELRLWDAIDQHRLVPFVYYGIHDGVDLRDIPWRRGRGYDEAQLSNVYTGNDVWARLVLKEIARRAESIVEMRALGFCVSISHARFMARVFSDAGVASVAIWSDTPAVERRDALKALSERKINVVFSVDLFNEGVDVPAVDTLLMLRPTDSPTLFLQQLGRGLRRYKSKAFCTVLDFVGQHRSEFRFDRRFRALLGGTRSEVIKQVEAGFPFLPAGCHLELDHVARDIVLGSMRNAVPAQWAAKVEELRAFASGSPTASLDAFLDASGLELEDIYRGGKSWSDLRRDAGLSSLDHGPHETTFRRACGRLLHVDDSVRIAAYRRMLALVDPPHVDSLGPADARLLRMLVASIVAGALAKTANLQEGCDLLWMHPQVRSELLELIDVLDRRIEHLAVALTNRPEVPLQIHARYTRIEMLAAFGVGSGATVAPWQTGAYWAADARTDLLAFTLDKTGAHFSPTTRYRDYAISRELIHWESQSVTRANSPTGLRYQQHAASGSSVMLFARLKPDDRAFYFLGPATYVRHESEQPMAVTWRLRHALPGDLFAAFAAAVA